MSSNAAIRGIERIWFPVLRDLGFRNVSLSSNYDDKMNATDVEADGKRFGVRSRYIDSYGIKKASSLSRDFYVRYSTVAGGNTEFQKIFMPEDLGYEIRRPDYLAYGWYRSGQLKWWLIVDVSVFSDLWHVGKAPFSIRVLKDGNRVATFNVEDLRNGIRTVQFQKLIPFRSREHPGFID